MPNDSSQSSTPTQLPSAPVANMGSLEPPPMGQGGIPPAEMNEAQMHQQMSPQSNMAHQANMGPSIAHMDMSNIDPNISYMQQQQQQQQQGMQIPGSGGGGGGGGYGQMKGEM